ncbi:ABC transporter substrate-binding protein [Brucella endophytica]|uniref:ABC transporter substrate-binding protein n=1 Tax=Brucella endophytica TaxID=1963359 RepID=A0A916WG75_9HYPH|nr:substrate-binding domain-containing protein [Brucella endophytica]GGA94229.1 ABC transporter substrate-binding protein [Brucella endophytica]
MTDQIGNGPRRLPRLRAFAASLLMLGTMQATPALAKDDAVGITFIIYTAAGDPFWDPVITGAKEAATDRGVNLDIQYGDSDPVKQNNLIETAIANGVDGIAIVNYLPDAFTANIAKARAAGIGVVTFDTNDPRPGATESQAYVGQDFFTAGQRIAKRMIEAGKLKAGDHVVAPVEEPDAFYGTERFRGIKSVLDEAGITSERLDATPTMATALTRISQYLLGNQNTKAVIGLGSVVTEVAPQAVKEAGVDIVVGGFDLSPGIIDAILNGSMVATIDSGAFYEGYMPVAMLYYQAKYGLPPSSIPIGGTVIDASNAAVVKEFAGTYR